MKDAAYAAGKPTDYDRESAVDTVKLFSFLEATQPDLVAELGIGSEGQSRKKL